VRACLKWSPRKAAFRYPIPPAPRTAVLVPGFRPGAGVRVFAEGWSEAAAKFAPQAIAATLAQLEAIAATGISVSHAIVVLGKWEDARLSETDREMLWTRFRVPVFEQIVDGNGTLLAAECEAHCGLHIATETMSPETPRARRGETDRIDESACACGRKTARLISREEAAREEAMRSIATYAR